VSTTDSLMLMVQEDFLIGLLLGHLFDSRTVKIEGLSQQVTNELCCEF
jgi:hypothetical protein